MWRVRIAMPKSPSVSELLPPAEEASAFSVSTPRPMTKPLDDTAERPISTPGPRPSGSHRPKLVGAAAERLAARHLWLRCWRICARNWIGGGGELDLVVSRWRTLVIVEVRRRPTLAAAFASVDRDKFNRTIAVANALVRAYSF